IDIYEKLIKGYTEKQWGRPCTELPAFIIKRLPVRLTFDNNYFNHPHQGIPTDGYTRMVERMLGIEPADAGKSRSAGQMRTLEGSAGRIEVRLGVDYLKDRDALRRLAKTVIYTGPIDEYFDYCYGALEYRSLRFETEILDVPNFQGVAGMNYTDSEHPYTRIVEHKHFLFGAGNPDKTVITREYSAAWSRGDEPYYPVNDEKNAATYEQYRVLAEKEDGLYFGGRLGRYQYLDMDKVIAQALADAAVR
ncbi:MAG: UDP-galactopyranose mutase, partial [Lachnospiraceae bacterium]|nr:UDP-galactopyranose mutase [Lachnospiraceae bacterium]